jgi:hypothetical protein
MNEGKLLGAMVPLIASAILFIFARNTQSFLLGTVMFTISSILIIIVVVIDSNERGFKEGYRCGFIEAMKVGLKREKS